MARIRTMKPEFFRNFDLFQTETKANAERTGPYLNLRAAFLGLITAADREGRFRWRPEELKLDALPYDPVDFREVLEILSAGPAPYIARYDVDGKAYGYIPGFLKHQRPKVDEAQSTIPAAPGSKPDSDQTPTGVQSAQGRERKGRERIGRETNEDDGFEAFYSLYPRKVAKADAIKAWRKLAPSSDLQVTIRDALRRQCASPDWLKENGKFIPYPASWLNARRWEDQGTVLPKAPSAASAATAAHLAARGLA